MFTRIRATAAIALISVFGCKTRSGSNELSEAWISLLDSKWQAVEDASDRNEYLRSYRELPEKAKLARLPWTDFSRNQSLHDLNYAVASILFAEPVAIKGSKSEAPYSAEAIKALLIRFVSENSSSDEGVETRSLGGICRIDSDSYRKALEPKASSLASLRRLDQNQCFSVNAGAFHLALANFIGLRGHSFLLDPDFDQEFAHYPVTAYKFETLGVPEAGKDDHAFLQMKATVQYLLPSGELKDQIYRYRLEMDAAGDIVNGDWMGESKPQLAWMQNRPKFGSNHKSLEEIYTRSVSLPNRLSVSDFSSMDLEDPRVPLTQKEPLVSNHKYRIELKGEVPRGADSLKSFLSQACRALGNVTIYRNTFADEDSYVSIELQVHKPLVQESLIEAIRDHSNGRAEIKAILR